MIERFRSWLRWVFGIGWVYFGTSYKRCADGHIYLVGHWHDTRTGKNREYILDEADLDPFG
jgi:hypothetical protein